MTENQAKDLFSSSTNVVTLNHLAIEDAKRRFKEFQNAGVIKAQCNFEDEVWYTTDQYANIGLHFKFNRFSYQQYQQRLQLSFEEFLLYVKAYLTICFGKNALDTMRSVLLDLRHIISFNIEEVCAISPNLLISLPAHCADFFSMLPDADKNEAIEELMNAMDLYRDRILSSQQKNQRALAAFDTYFRFDDLLEDFWRSDLSEEDRLFYYPLLLWWRITGVIPLRPREFLLTERNCLSKDADGNYYLRLRRNKLKGSNRSITYKLDEDYIIETYKIPESLASELQQYLDLTQMYEETELNTLFVTDPHYKKWGHAKHSDSRYLTYMNMSTILKYFYKEVLVGKYGLHVVSKPGDRYLQDYEIGRIHLGDTRHIALINIMQEGGTPVTAMLLAGHDNAITGSHYYSNLTSLIECKTYRQYRKMLIGDRRYQLSSTALTPKVGFGKPLEDGGQCFSTAYQQGKIDDCLDSIGRNGEIGYCPTCTYYRNIGTFHASDDIYKRNIHEDCTSLQQVVDIVRAGKGSTEDIGEILLRIRSSSLSYQAYLLSKYAKESAEKEME